MITDPDASGGLGSFSKDLWGVLTGALSQVAAPALGKALDLQATTDAQGNLRYAASPAPPTKVSAQVTDLLKNPLVMIVGIALVVGVAVALIKR